MSLPPENAQKAHCEHGHPLAGDNLLVLRRSDGRQERVCRACANRRGREHWRRHHFPRLPRVHWAGQPRELRLSGAKQPKPVTRRPRRAPHLRVLDHTLIIEGGCWLWQGALNNGYGLIQLGRGEGTAKAHRVMYAHFKGPIPDGLDVMHVCHERACVNPAHLEAGTRAENMQQSKQDGRLVRARQHARK